MACLTDQVSIYTDVSYANGSEFANVYICSMARLYYNHNCMHEPYTCVASDTGLKVLLPYTMRHPRTLMSERIALHLVPAARSIR